MTPSQLQQIATHLQVKCDQINWVRVQYTFKGAEVLLVCVYGKSPRFVSAKVIKQPVLTVQEALELADKQFMFKGIYNQSKSSTTRTYAFRGVPVGSIMYERYTKKYQVKINGVAGIRDYFVNVNDAIEFFLDNTEIVWSKYSTVA